MGEWVLILALNIASSTPGEIRDVSLSTMGGFGSKASCEAAAQTLTSRAVAVVGQARMQGGIQGNSAKSTPVLNFECVFIKK
ncbi:hypothetical protein KGA65_18630 [Ideonella sp. B7]|uniref:hypothetical protein n=1 Tax=Ideonella benzenivorans TaxID=2831643 RepID=UPI001CED7D0E|nr:hypothetical protein [Ideonella benzenivorans]MCA6218560.1 hypothetical protein [Ideonella benzenivorans]